ncbi:hypothetical protein J1605_019340 [Eschrichtius robustus]|uniref:Calcium-activated chloride channel regulator 2 n=1 Tax=Eschrichtius robustus TaxID=9764 RepID=A0AB34HR19_ESCRO|nr:hypothetical protein J1605_019340 [Eschrichtius robustus]
MTHGDSAGPVCSLKFVTLLVVLGPELLFVGARVQLQENGYNGLLVAINPQVSEDQNLIPNIKANVIVTDWYGAHGEDAYTLQYRGCGEEGKYIHFTPDFLLNDDLTAGYGSRGTELPPPPTFSLVQAGDKVVCLVLDVSSKMAKADRLLQLQQAAEFYLMQIVEIHTFVGIASFNSKGTIRAQLHQINNDDDRKLLVSYLPATVSAEAETSVCSGLKKGFEMVEKLNGKAFGSVMILVTSGDDEHITNCFLTVLSSGSTIHTIALGSPAVKNLEELSHLTAVLPATVEAFVERDSTHFPHPVTIYAIVRKGFYPILNATVTATVESETADPVTLKLFDDGAGNIQMNAPRKSVGRREEEQRWGFSRISSGGSFFVLGVPADPHPDVFPPCKIIDLEAVKVEEEVILSWTAPGEDFDQGQGWEQFPDLKLSNPCLGIDEFLRYFPFSNAFMPAFRLPPTSSLDPHSNSTEKVF